MASITEYTILIRQKISEIYNNTIGRFISSLFRKPASILFLGIDNAGKTTLVSKLKNNTNHVFLPTKHATKDVVEIGNLKALVVDIGGHKAVRFAWKDYFYNVDGVVFIVDTEDQGRFEEVRESWASVTELAKDAPILVLMNKIDLLGHDTKSIKMDQQLIGQLENSTGIAGKPNVEVVYLSIVRESVYDKDSALCNGFTWLSKKIEERQKNNN